MFNRSSNSSLYRYGFGGQEKDDEISGEGNSYTAEFWQYDPRLGRRWNVDPIVKYHESPYATFANNPIWFIDPNGANAVFADDKAEEDFTKAHKKVVNKVSSLQTDLQNYKDELKQPGLKKGQIKRINKKINQTQSDLDDWNLLAADFEAIINSPVDFIYSSDVSSLPEGFDGQTGLETDKLFTNEDGKITGGTVHIFVRGGMDEIIIHENRHGNQRLERLGLTKLQRETAGYIYQRIYNANSVVKFIEDQRNAKYGHIEENIRPNMDLEEAIKFKYEIE